jgi:polar amino acid transport system substrate-binding protein
MPNTHKITVGVLPAPPYSFIDPISNGWKGIEADFGRQFAKIECLAVATVTVSGANAIHDLQSGKIDLLSAGAYITPERGKVVGQTDPIYYQYTVATSKSGLASLASLKGHTVGVQAGSAFVVPLGKAIGSSRVKQYAVVKDLLSAVDADRIDAAVTASGEAAYNIKQLNLRGLASAAISTDPAATKAIYGVNMPYNKSKTAFGAMLNDDIKRLRADGTVKRILSSWEEGDELSFQGK